MASARRNLLLRYGLLGLGLLALIAFLPVRRMLVALLSEDYTKAQSGVPLRPDSASGARAQIAVTLERVAEGLPQPTDIQFPPGSDEMAVVLSKTGIAHWVALDSGLHGRLLQVEVVTSSEEGLLGLAFHPGYRGNGRIFLNYVAAPDGHDQTFVEEWKLDPPDDLRRAKATRVRVLLRVDQPYQNHNAGQLSFGPDGMLYVGFGDGGFRDDPHGHGQNPRTLLGSMLRIDVNGAAGKGTGGKPYSVPKDNPFVGKQGYAPETWAYGLRNPWRYSFDPKGRLIVADVGQDAFEEIDIVSAGDNLGWVIREGFACHAKDKSACQRDDLVDPVLVYGRDLGTSITGGFVYTGNRVPALRGLYVFGDFVSGRLFAMKLPDDRRKRVEKPIDLGKWPVFPSSFGRDAKGELYVASFAAGELLRLGPAAAPGQPKPSTP